MFLFRGASVILMTVIPAVGMGHSGGTDENGCHSGSQPYHCHNDGGSDDLNDAALSDSFVNAIALVAAGWVVWSVCNVKYSSAYTRNGFVEDSESKFAPMVYVEPSEPDGKIRLGIEYQF